MVCHLLKKAICQQLKDYHIQYHFNRYVKTLCNKEYMLSRNMSKAQVDEEIRHLWNRRLQLEQYDEIKNGKRIRKVAKFCFFDIDKV